MTDMQVFTSPEFEGLRIVEGNGKPDEMIRINYSDTNKPTCSARELHEFLEVETAYKDWFPRMCEYGFTEGVDFNPLKFERVQKEGARTVTRVVNDAEITLDMAKELCMLQRTEKGKQVRLYLLEVERQWNTPEMVMKRALDFANRAVEEMQSKLSVAMAENSRLVVENQIARPKAEYFDQLVERNTLTNFRETAKELNIPPRQFVQFLLDKKYVYRDKKGKLLPFESKNDGLFEVKDCVNEKTQWSGTQTLITPKGRETFRLLYV